MQQSASIPVVEETSSDTLNLLESVSVASRDNNESCDPSSECEDNSMNISDDDTVSGKSKNMEKSVIQSSASMKVAVSESISENERQEMVTDENDEETDTGSTVSEKNLSPSKLQIPSSVSPATPSGLSVLGKSSDAIVTLPSKPTITKQSNSSMQRKLLQRVVEGQRQIQKVKEGLIAALASQATTSKTKTDPTPPTAVVKLPSSSSSVKLVLKEKTREGLHRVLGALGVQESNFDEILAKINVSIVYLF